MGHYRAEMRGREDEERARRYAETRKKRLAAIKTDIEKRGLEEVLLDIIEDAGMYRVHHFHI